MSAQAKLLRKYLDEPRAKREAVMNEGTLKMRDEDEREIEAQSSSSEERPRRRVESSDSQKEEATEDRKQRKAARKLRRALGLSKSEDVAQFMQLVKLEGNGVEELKTNLRINRRSPERKRTREQKIKQQYKGQREQRKQRELKEQREQVTKLRLPNNYSESSSDMEVPEAVRTVIYRNKDGSLRRHSDKQQAEMQRDKVMAQLSEWETGMKKEEPTEHNEDILHAQKTVWDDPLKQWQAPSLPHPFLCKYEGYANRFGIRPGHRWDGVVRGNGFENTFLLHQNRKKINQHKQHMDHLKHL